jgi:hypothetical protein
MALMDFDPWTQEKLDYNMSRILPEGWFFAVEAKTSGVVGTAMCLHNYGGHSPFTGDLGWLACHSDFLGNGLGRGDLRMHDISFEAACPLCPFSRFGIY